MKNKVCVFPGSFDPPTLGHLDIIKRAAALFDKVYVGVLDNTSKSFMFDKAVRVNMLAAAVSGMDNVCVVSFDGMLVDFAKKVCAGTVVRGVRTETDFSYERQMYLVNSALQPELDTVIFPAGSDTAAVSSTFVREILRFGGDVSSFVPKEVCAFFE